MNHERSKNIENREPKAVRVDSSKKIDEKSKRLTEFYEYLSEDKRLHCSEATPQELLNSERESILCWTQKNKCLFPKSRLEKKLEELEKLAGGNEHVVYFDEDSENVFKITIPPNYGCLLYTSPSPRDLSTSRMPSSA